MGNLKGRDVNGMHAAQWGKLDTSAISKVKVPDKCTNEQLASAVKQMLVEAVEKLYGTNKDKKYVKIVDMIMMRMRGALEKLNNQIQEAQEENSKSFDVDELISELSKTLTKIVEENSKTRDKDISSKLQKVYKSVNELIENETKKSNDENSQNTGNKQDEIQGQQDQNTKSSGSIEDFDKINTELQQQHDSSQNQLQLLEDLQKQITDNFSKIENLITANSMQKNAEAAAVQMNKPVEDKIVNIEKSNEKQIRESISSLNAKTGKIDDDNDKDSKKGKEKKTKEKSNKNTLKDIMTGKQFNMLKNLLTNQFYEVVDISDTIVKNTNKEFKKINDSIKKLIKERQKNGFSWTKLILFLSLFFIPFFWSSIKNLIKNFSTDFDIDGKIDAAFNYVDRKVTNYIKNINWEQHAITIKDEIWKYIKKKFDEFIKDPMGWMANEIENVYNSCVEWVKDLWRVVTGKSKDENNAEKKKIEEQHVNKINANIEDFKNNLSAHNESIGNVAVNQTNELKKEIEKSNNYVITSEAETTQRLDRMQNVVEVNTKNLENTALSAITSTSNFASKSHYDLQSGVDSALSVGMQAMTNDAKSIIDAINKNGPPSPFDKAMMNAFERQAANIEEQSPDNLTQPDISKLTSVKDYVMVNTGDKNTGNVIAKKSEVNEQLKQLEKKTNSNSVQHIQNMVDFGEFTTTENIINKFKNPDDDDEKIERLAILDQYKKKNGVEQKISSETSNESLVEREARLYTNINNAYDAVIKNSATIKDGLNKNQEILSQICTDCNTMFNDISITLKTIKGNQSTVTNNTSIVSINSTSTDADSLVNANMKK